MSVAASQLQLNFAERAVKRRPTSLILGMLLAVVGFIVLFVSNVIAVNALSGEMVETSSALQRTIDANQQLRADISRLTAVDRITAEASKLGLVQSQKPGTVLIPRSQ
jgi:cell division protein FtsL